MRLLVCTALLSLACLTTALQPPQAASLGDLEDAFQPASPAQLARLEADDLRTDVGPQVMSIIATTYLARPAPTARSISSSSERGDDDESQVVEAGMQGGKRMRKRDKVGNIWVSVTKLGALSPLLRLPITLLLYLLHLTYLIFHTALLQSVVLAQYLLAPFFLLANKLLAPFRLLYALFIAFTPLWIALCTALLVGGSLGALAAAVGGAGFVKERWELSWLGGLEEKVERLLGSPLGARKGRRLGGREVQSEVRWERVRPTSAPRMEVPSSSSSSENDAPRRPSTRLNTRENVVDDSIERWRREAEAR